MSGLLHTNVTDVRLFSYEVILDIKFFIQYYLSLVIL